MKISETDKRNVNSNQLDNIKKKYTSKTPTTPPITDSFCPSTIERETSASISNYGDIIITKSSQHNKSIIINLNNKNKKAKVIEKISKRLIKPINT